MSENFIDPIGYRSEREPDHQYRELLEAIMLRGEEQTTALVLDEDGVERKARARYVDMYTMRFDLRNGLPLITERNLSNVYNKAMGELIGFINGARTLNDLASYGMPRSWWEPQITPEKTAKRGLEPGDLGSASYGPVLTAMPDRQGQPFNQIKAMVDQIRHQPQLRTHWATSLYPPESYRGPGYEQKVVVVPCHGSVLHARVTDSGELKLKHFQRSGDVPVGVVNNMAQWATFTVMLAQATGYKPSEYIHVISDAHIYENQFEFVEQLLDRSPRPFPKMLTSEQVPADHASPQFKDIFAFRKDDFLLDEVDSHPYFRIPTPR